MSMMLDHVRQTKTKPTTGTKSAATKSLTRQGSRPQGESSRGTAAASASTISDIKDIRFNLQRCSFYHEMREHFCTRTDKILKFLSIILSSSVVVTLLASWPSWLQLLCAFATVCLGGVTVLCDFSVHAKHHALMRRSFKEAYTKSFGSGNDAVHLNQNLHQLYEEEEGIVYRIVDAVAFNQTAQHLGKPRGVLLEVGFWMHLFRNIWPASTLHFYSHDELGGK